MKTLVIFSLIHVLLSLCTLQAASTAAQGNSSGGGGDPHEIRVNDIRAELMNWIISNGSRSIVFPEGILHKDYTLKMIEILQPKLVVIGFVENDNSADEELRVVVNDVPKTCRGFVSSKDSRPHILCNIPRFDQTSEAELYKLIHHEYAGFVGIENNSGASSDYSISSQLGSYLEPVTIYRLSVKNKFFQVTSNEVTCSELQASLKKHKAIEVITKNLFKTKEAAISFTEQDQCNDWEKAVTANYKTLDSSKCSVGYYCKRIKDYDVKVPWMIERRL
jgi:hypothetical protein